MWVLIPEKFHRLRLSLFISPLRSPSLSRSLDFCSVFRASRLNNWTCCGQCSKNVFISTCQEIYVQMHWTSHHSTNIKNSGIASCKENEDSGIREIFATGIWNPGLWNPEYNSKNPESFQRLKSGIQVPLRKNPESSTWNLESTAWNPESKRVLDSLTLGDRNF